MRKLTLDVAELHVESFRTGNAAGPLGTVHGARAVEPMITGPVKPVEHTGCTDECMSGASMCPIMSCGSDCVPDTNAGADTPFAYVAG